MQRRRTDHEASLPALVALLVALATVATPAAAKPKPIMVYTGKLTPIMPRLPTPPPPVPFPPAPPAPVWEDPEPGFNPNLLPLAPSTPFKYGFRLKPLRTYVPPSSYSKGVVYSWI